MDRLLHSAQGGSIQADHPTHTIRLAPDAVVSVTKVVYVDGYTLQITFSDGATRDVDFGPFLTMSTNPMIRKYLDPARFQNFTVQDGDLFWNDYDLCFPVADLYENTI